MQEGLTLENLSWALTTTDQSNWHPLAWLSHMLDVQLFPLDAQRWPNHPGLHHLTSVILHASSAVLLMLVLEWMTGSLVASALVAAFFALHPLHVESVAWVAERKDVLSGLFWMLTLAAYVFYVRRPGRVRYVGVMVMLALGLMAKPMLVTLPFVLLLLDYWPLGRLRRASGSERCHAERSEASRLAAKRDSSLAALAQNDSPGRALPPVSIGWLILEKVPLLALAAGSCILTYMAQSAGGSVVSVEELPLDMRLANVPVAYLEYLGKTFWPADLAVFYPYHAGRPLYASLAATAALAVVTVLVVWQRRRRPYLAVGWFWYLGMLVPVIGLVQVGEQSMADRYTYLPLVGIFIMGVWGARDLAAGRRAWQVGLVCAFAAALVACAALAQQQVACWKDSKALLEHDIEAAGDNPMARGNLGVFYMDDTRLEKSERLRRAIAEFRRALQLNSRYVFAHNNLGLALAEQDNLSEAIDHYRIALQIDPRHAPTHNNLGMALARQDNLDMAIQHYREAIDLRPDYAKAYNNLASALYRQGKVNEAIDGFRRAIALDRRYARPHNNLGMVLAQLGLTDEAIAEYREGLRLDPENAKTHNNLGLAWLDKGDAAAAAAEFEAALALSPGMAEARANLATARARLRGAGAP